MITFPAKIVYDRDERVFTVEFPDLPGCVTYGENLDQAKKFAREALSGYLSSLDSRKHPIPRSSRPTGKNYYRIAPDKNVAFALSLKQKRLKAGMTQAQIARALRISYQTYQRFENPVRANPTLKTIKKIEAVLRESLVEV